jgi:hypothetical protein
VSRFLSFLHSGENPLLFPFLFFFFFFFFLISQVEIISPSLVYIYFVYIYQEFKRNSELKKETVKSRLCSIKGTTSSDVLNASDPCLCH